MIYRILEQVAATSSRTEKEALLAQHANDPLLRKVLIYAYDPFKVFGIGKLPKPAKHGNNTLTIDSKVWNALDALAERLITGDKAKKLVEDWLSLLDEESASVFGRILMKDLRAGFTEGTINRVIPGLVPTFDCMLAKPFEAKRVKSWPQRADIKEDGVRVLTFIQLEPEPKVGFFSRSGKPFTSFDHLKPILLAGLRSLTEDWLAGELSDNPNNTPVLTGCRIVLESEIVSGSFNKTVSEVRKKDVAALDSVIKAFDILPASLFDGNEETDSRLTGYEERRKLVTEFVKRCPTLDVKEKTADGTVTEARTVVEVMTSYWVNSEAEITQLFERVRARGKEGLIIKSPDGIYRRKRAFEWMKIKAEESADVKVTGAFEGEGKYAGMLGGMLVDFNGVEVRVGGGFSDEQRKDFWESWLIDKRRIDENDVMHADELLLVGRLVEVEYHEVTPDGSLRHPRFVRFRDDKDVPEKKAA